MLASRHWDTISTRTPLAGSDRTEGAVRNRRKFQPALPLRGVTTVIGVAYLLIPNFNPHPPCGE